MNMQQRNQKEIYVSSKNEDGISFGLPKVIYVNFLSINSMIQLNTVGTINSDKMIGIINNSEAYKVNEGDMCYINNKPDFNDYDLADKADYEIKSKIDGLDTTELIIEKKV